ncbi:MAG TPA: carbohydrate porin, partial [Acetobacteraceae bacterium]|nr:carbohydrate porin [Acetobacteraceae bacterium]
PVQAYYQLGLVMQGTFKDRPKDSAGFLATYYVFNPRVTGATNDAIAAAGHIGHMSNSESIFEANYGIALKYGLTIKPYIDLTVDPDQALYDVVVPNPRIHFALAVGTQLNIGL